MAILLFIFIILSMYHFVYESIILPTIRLKLRYDLFELRDKLRQQLPESGPDDKKKILLLDSAINGTINKLPNITISSMLSLNKLYNRNLKYKKNLEYAVSQIDTCSIDEVIRINNKLKIIIFKVFVFNLGGWFYIGLPIVLLLLLLFFILNKISDVKAYLKYQTNKVAFVKDEQFPSVAGAMN